MKPTFGYEYKPAANLLTSGDDVTDFLQSQFSNDLQPAESGRCVYGLWLDVKGKVIADSFVLCEGDAQFRILSERSLAEIIMSKLERHIIADDVVIERLPALNGLALMGEEVAEILQSLALPVPGEDTFATVDGIYIYRGRRSQESSFELCSDSAGTISDLRSRLAQAGVEFVSMQQSELIRLAAGIPRIPSEIGPSDLPGEGGLVDNGVSLTKGCYLGQEVVARMHNVGRAQRALFLMQGAVKPPNCPVPLYSNESKLVGELRSVFLTEDGWQGVALLKTRYANTGCSLSYEDGSADVIRLFVKEVGCESDEK